MIKQRSEGPHLEIAPHAPKGSKWVELREGSHHFACNVSGCPRGANVALSDNPGAFAIRAYDVRCWVHCPVLEHEVITR